MNAQERMNKLNTINGLIAIGRSELGACLFMKTTKWWYRRTKQRYELGGFEGLQDQPRSGRPRKQS